MKRNVYLKLQIKKAFKIYPEILFVTLVALLCIAVAAGVLLKNTLNSSEQKKFTIGIVENDNDPYLRSMIKLAEQMDTVRFAIETREMDAETAEAALKSGEISGYLDIPKNFMRSVLNGSNNYPISCVVNSASAGINVTLTEEFARLASNMFTEIQRGVYSVCEVAYDIGRDEDIDEQVEKINMIYANHVLNRSDLFKCRIVNSDEKISYVGYYACSGLLFFALMWGISSCRFFSGRNAMLGKLLRVHGIDSGNQLLCEYAAYFIVTAVTVLGCWSLLAVLARIAGVGETERALCGFGFAIKLIPVILMLSMMQFTLYEVMSGTVGAVLAQFLAAVGFGYISGCFYPNTFFPELIRNTAEMLPVGVAFAYMRKIACGETVWRELGLNVLYTVIFASVSVMLRKRKIRVA